MMFKREEGFTLVELMVVVLIIGILVAIAIPVFLNASANAQAKSCQANQRTINGSVQTAVAAGELQMSNNVAQWNDAGTWTNVAAGAVDGGSTAGTWAGILVPKYVKVAPFCPAGTAATNRYKVSAAGVVVSDQGAAAADDAWAVSTHELQ